MNQNVKYQTKQKKKIFSSASEKIHTYITHGSVVNSLEIEKIDEHLVWSRLCTVTVLMPKIQTLRIIYCIMLVECTNMEKRVFIVIVM